MWKSEGLTDTQGAKMTKAQIAKKIDILDDQYGWSTAAEQIELDKEISKLLDLYKAVA
jgi:hypothetical protein